MPQRLKPSSSSESNDLRNAGLKVTLPRLKILDILADGSARHMSAEDIYKKLLVLNEDVGLATVYRVLTQFEAAGVVPSADENDSEEHATCLAAAGVFDVGIAAPRRGISCAASWRRLAIAPINAAGRQPLAVHGLFKNARNLL